MRAHGAWQPLPARLGSCLQGVPTRQKVPLFWPVCSTRKRFSGIHRSCTPWPCSARSNDRRCPKEGNVPSFPTGGSRCRLKISCKSTSSGRKRSRPCSAAMAPSPRRVGVLPVYRGTRPPLSSATTSMRLWNAVSVLQVGLPVKRKPRDGCGGGGGRMVEGFRHRPVWRPRRAVPRGG